MNSLPTRDRFRELARRHRPSFPCGASRLWPILTTPVPPPFRRVVPATGDGFFARIRPSTVSGGSMSSSRAAQCRSRTARFWRDGVCPAVEGDCLATVPTRPAGCFGASSEFVVAYRAARVFDDLPPFATVGRNRLPRPTTSVRPEVEHLPSVPPDPIGCPTPGGCRSIGELRWPTTTGANGSWRLRGTWLRRPTPLDAQIDAPYDDANHAGKSRQSRRDGGRVFGIDEPVGLNPPPKTGDDRRCPR